MPALNLKVFFEAIDKMSGPLQTIGIAFDGMDKAAKTAAKTLRNWGAVSAVSFAAFEGGKKASDAMERFGKSAEPLAEARTHFEQIAGAANLTKANLEALTLSQKYGAASWQQEIEALTRAYQIYGNYADAVKAAVAANKLATATGQGVGDTLDQLAISARNAGVPVQVMADKLAKLYQLAGPAVGAPRELRQLERGYSLAKAQGVSLDKFLAIAAEMQKTEGPGAARDLFTYFEQTTKKGGGLHLSQRSLAVHNLIQAHAKEIAAAEAALRSSHGATQQILEKALVDPARQLAIAQAKAQSLEQGIGAGSLGLHSEIASAVGDLEAYAAKLIALNPNITTLVSDTALLGAQVLKLAGVTGGAIISLRALTNAISALSLSAAKSTGTIGGEEAASEASRASKISKLAGKAGTVGAAVAGGAAWAYYVQYRLPTAIGAAIGDKLKQAIAELRAEDRRHTETHVHVKLDGHEIAHAVAKHDDVKARTKF